MVSVDEIENEILTLEAKDTSYAVVERLAWLYTVRDHLKGVPTVITQTAEVSQETPFLAAFTGAPINEALDVVNEHFEAIRTLYPKEYQAVVARLEELK